MIVNLVGAPAAGKSTFATRFILEHPNFTYCSIDSYRFEYENEARAWAEMTKDVLNHRHTVIESCGMSWKLGELLNLPTTRRRPMTTLLFTGTKEDLLHRLRERQHKRPLPEPFRQEDEILAIDYALEHFKNKVVTKVNKVIWTSDTEVDTVYHVANHHIQRNLFFRNNRREYRKYLFPDAPNKGEISQERAKRL